jgi:glycosyltransferase involved in cell wall biosynthesis
MTSDLTDFLVIVPTYRRPEYLAQALKSALAQSGVKKRIIVIDDCPEGSAECTVAGMDPAVTYVKNPQPSGGWPAKVRNFGLEASTRLGIEARFVHFLDDDDTVPFGHYERVMQAFAAHPDAGVVFGVLRPFCVPAENPQRRARQEAQLFSTRRHFARAARLAWIYHHVGATLRLPSLRKWLYRSHAIFGSYLFLCSGAVIRHGVVAKLEGFNPQIRITEDYEFFTRAILASGAHFLERISANYRLGNVEALWSSLELSRQEEMHRQVEVNRYLARRSLQLRSEVGLLRFRAQQIAFRLLELALNSAVIPLMDRFGMGGARRWGAPRPASA